MYALCRNKELYNFPLKTFQFVKLYVRFYSQKGMLSFIWKKGTIFLG